LSADTGAHTPGHNFPLPSPRTLVPAPRAPIVPRTKAQTRQGRKKKSSVFFTASPALRLIPRLSFNIPSQFSSRFPRLFPCACFGNLAESYCCFCWRLKVSLTPTPYFSFSSLFLCRGMEYVDWERPPVRSGIRRQSPVNPSRMMTMISSAIVHHVAKLLEDFWKM
jgi:hypothetical protein